MALKCGVPPQPRCSVVIGPRSDLKHTCLCVTIFARKWLKFLHSCSANPHTGWTKQVNSTGSPCFHDGSHCHGNHNWSLFVTNHAVAIATTNCLGPLHVGIVIWHTVPAVYTMYKYHAVSQHLPYSRNQSVLKHVYSTVGQELVCT